MGTPAKAVDSSISKIPIPLDAENLPTVCVLCSHNCGLRVDVSGGRISRVRADKDNPITRGYICNKGFRIGNYVDHRQRVEHPLRRRSDGTFERVSWDTAISEIGAKLSSIREAHAPRAIGLVGIGGQGNHMDGAYGLTWLTATGSKRWFNALAQEKHQHFLVEQWMFDAAPSVMFHPDLEKVRYLLVMGTNPKISNRGHNATDTFKALASDPARTVIVIDPRETETSRDADRHLRLRPGTDVYFLLGIAATLVSEDALLDRQLLEERTEGFETLREALAAIDVELMARRCGTTADEIQSVAREFARAEGAAIMWDLALEQVPFSTLISYLIRLISVLTGNAGRRGGSVFMEMATPPHRSGKRFAEPERALASGIRSISALGGFAMFSPTLVPEEIMIDHPERLRALVVEGANPMLTFSDTARWREARERLDLLVVIDPAMTETAQIADYVLPTPTGYEKWEQAGFPKGFPEVYMQLRPPVVAGPEEALPEPEIYARLAEAMGLVGEPPEELAELAADALEPEGAARYFMALQSASSGNPGAMLFWAYRTLGPRLASPALTAIWALCHQNAFMRGESVLRTLGPDWKEETPFALAAELFRRMMAHPEGVEIAKADAEQNLEANLGYDDGRVRVAPELMIGEIGRAAATAPMHDPDYPFVLAGGLRTPWTANTVQRDPAWRKAKGEHCALHLSPADAVRLGVDQGEQVRVRTRRGAVELPAAVDAKVLDGHVWIPNGFGVAYPDERGELVTQGVNINVLIDAADRDPISGCPHTKHTLCQVERA
ncbi:MAG: molybdopterin-dependent oxidoreductase [Myxococcota bacterium]